MLMSDYKVVNQNGAFNTDPCTLMISSMNNTDYNSTATQNLGYPFVKSFVLGLDSSVVIAYAIDEFIITAAPSDISCIY